MFWVAAPASWDSISTCLSQIKYRPQKRESFPLSKMISTEHDEFKYSDEKIG